MEGNNINWSDISKSCRVFNVCTYSTWEVVESNMQQKILDLENNLVQAKAAMSILEKNKAIFLENVFSTKKFFLRNDFKLFLDDRG
jgi:hypothetical protein